MRFDILGVVQDRCFNQFPWRLNLWQLSSTGDDFRLISAQRIGSQWLHLVCCCTLCTLRDATSICLSALVEWQGLLACPLNRRSMLIKVYLLGLARSTRYHPNLLFMKVDVIE